MSLTPELRERLDRLVSAHEVLLFMKGTRAAPQCGFSSSVVDLLDDHLEAYETVDILTDEALREGVKAYSDWPTFPQLYVRGKLVGGADIVKELAASKELARVLGAPARDEAPPRIRLSERAAAAIRGASADADEGAILHFVVTREFQYDLFFDVPAEGLLQVDAGGLTVALDRQSARRADGVIIDFVESPGGAGFKIENPNEPPKVQSVTAPDLAKRRASGEPLVLFDVRTEQEREIARIDGAVWLDAAGREQLDALDRETRLVFQCHHGVRSRAAAEHALRMGFRHVWNLEGGIDAWSALVDPAIPRY